MEEQVPRLRGEIRPPENANHELNRECQFSELRALHLENFLPSFSRVLPIRLTFIQGVYNIQHTTYNTYGIYGL